MPTTMQDVRQTLLAQDPEFRQLAEEHSRCESQLESLRETPYVNSEAFLQEVILKKRKLLLKDRMEFIVAHHRRDSLHH